MLNKRNRVVPDEQWDLEANLIRYIRASLRIIAADFVKSNIPLVFWRNDGSPKITGKRGHHIFLPSDNNGQADFEIAILGVPRIHIEAKATKGRQSPHQVAHQRKVEAVGERYFIVRNPNQFANALRECGIEHWSLGDGD